MMTLISIQRMISQRTDSLLYLLLCRHWMKPKITVGTCEAVPGRPGVSPHHPLPSNIQSKNQPRLLALLFRPILN